MDASKSRARRILDKALHENAEKRRKMDLENRQSNVKHWLIANNFGEERNEDYDETPDNFYDDDDSVKDPNFEVTDETCSVSSSSTISRENNSKHEIRLKGNQEAEHPREEEGSQEAENQRDEQPCQTPMKRYSRRARRERKECRQTGKSYTTASGKLVSARKQSPLKQCRLKCSNVSMMKICKYYSLNIGIWAQ
ncbi:uncharacterized protein [Macrobrachium rosenbergii]|uniref:uncharacterized protein n=1 Tax=Macrobrachium rosenbergii TaxID=79674 RepID=UPI0034D79617